MKWSIILIVSLFLIWAFIPGDTNGDELDRINVPEGFEISYFATDVKEARSLAVAENGWVFVSTRRHGSVYALKDNDGDGKADVKITLVEDWNQPNGIVIHGNDLYVAEIHRIHKFSGIVEHPDKSISSRVIYDDLPEHKHHGWRYINIGPDEKLYTAIGAPCNICLREEPHFASISRMNLDGSEFEVVQHGIRNSVGFDWHPETNHLWFTDNNRDWLGDDLPACELNVAIKDGEHFGYPFCHQGDLPDPKFGKMRSCDEFKKPAQNLVAHSAPLGLCFLGGVNVPPSFKKRLLIAEHGSWNRTTPVGYRIAMVDIQKDKASNYQVFADGWLHGSDKYGRPVDICAYTDGGLLVSDDFNNAIYKIDYVGDK
jgi:glucose/arabinose dehydrogenase